MKIEKDGIASLKIVTEIDIFDFQIVPIIMFWNMLLHQNNSSDEIISSEI